MTKSGNSFSFKFKITLFHKYFKMRRVKKVSVFKTLAVTEFK